MEDKKEMESPGQKYSDFGYELVRKEFLQELLGQDEGEILYWGGRVLARKHPVHSLEEVIQFFTTAGWGELQLIKERKEEMTLQLLLPEEQKKPLFNRQLEAGFLAEQIETQKNAATETVIVEKKYRIEFHIHWNLKETVLSDQ
ncbi:DUF2507 domain-containing protein [Salsuginibacillus kocurii]|uniref:DUF2507 domain-containing protein n=1 Tax=Salsuginibacillus kocurii TaxID=427078 RepID=UPI00037B2250|nr:DUF2507 domain-containing protein [Salsuginibacillus kocurii]